MKFLILISLCVIGSFASHEHNNFDTTACLLPPVTGDCRAMFHKFYYNSTTHNCQEFVYGGCGGNANKFEHKEDCESHCKNIHELNGRSNSHSGTDSSLIKSSCLAFVIAIPIFLFNIYYK